MWAVAVFSKPLAMSDEAELIGTVIGAIVLLVMAVAIIVGVVVSLRRPGYYGYGYGHYGYGHGPYG